MHDAHPHRPRRLIAPAGHDRGPDREPGGRGARADETAGDRRSFVGRGQARRVDPHLREQLRRPAPAGHVEEQGPRGVRHVGRALSGEPPPDVVLGQQHRTHPRPLRRLLVAHPQQFRQGEPGEGGIADQLDQARRPDLVGEPPALGAGPLVAPDDSGPHHRSRRVEQHRAVHLSGQSDGPDGAGRRPPGRQGRPDGRPRRAPPVFGMLLGPAGPGRVEGRVRLGGRRRHGPVRLDDRRARPAGSDIKPQHRHRSRRIPRPPGRPGSARVDRASSLCQGRSPSSLCRGRSCLIALPGEKTRYHEGKA